MESEAMMRLTQISTARLRLVALNAELAELQLRDRMGFFDALGVMPEPSWPPDLMDQAAMEWMRDQLAARPDDAGWYGWVYISPALNRLVGTGGFKGVPSAAGEVEIGYSMLNSYREQGLATEGVLALLDWAYDHDAVKSVIAQTRADRNASHRVLEKAGFVETGKHEDPEDGFEVLSWRNERARAAA
ncbi:GNAT family N-acetyltransferase [Maricaulis sp.]|uniref:GNAT family N-acetyltransferase n=1 Tax=Maricaulis sp. TaxID=1486257 RepID=UPI00260AC4F2|nr:GNAT family N-acetyltransferase [Maricaulis sp.]